MALKDSTTANSRRARLRFITVALFVLGATDLVVRGWGGDARLLLFAGAMLVTLMKGGRSGAVAFALSMIGLLISAVVGPASSIPSFYSQPALGTLLLGLGVFLALGILTVYAAHFRSREADEKLDQARQETRALAKTVLDARIAALQTSNQTLQRRTRTLEASLSVSQLLSTAFDVPALLSGACERIAEQFGFGSVMIYLVDAAEEWADLQSASTVSGKALVLRGVRVRNGSGGPVGWVMAQKQSQVLSYTQREAVESGYLGDAAPGGAGASLTLPLMVGKQLLGVLDVHTDLDTTSVNAELSLLEELAAYLALAMNSARRLGGQTAASEATDVTVQTAVRLAAARTEEDVYDVIASTLRVYGPSRILFVQSAGALGELHVVAELQGTNLITLPRALGRLTPVALIDVVILGLTLDAPLWVRDLASLDEELNPELRAALAAVDAASDAQAQDAEPCHALAFIPVRLVAEGAGTPTSGSSDAPVGGFIVLYSMPHRFTPIEQRHHRLLMDLGGAALERSRLLSEARIRLDHEAVLRTVGQRLRSSLDPDVIMQEAVQALGKALDAEFATIEVSSEISAQATADALSSGEVTQGSGNLVVNSSDDGKIAPTRQGA